MKLFDKPIVMITHNDLDGCGSPVVLNYITSETNDEVEAIYYTNNGDVETTIEHIIEKYGTGGYKLFICDHSPTLAYYERMVDEGIDFMIFDHHKSSEVQGLENVVFDVAQCATALFYDVALSTLAISNEDLAFEINDVIEQFVYHVNDYDMWQHESPHTKRLNELLYETTITDFVARFSKDPDPNFTDIEEIIVSTAEKKRDKYINKAEKTVQFHRDHEGNKYGVVFAEQHQSQLGHELNERLGLDYVFMVNAQASKVSLRSEGRVDVSVIAKHFGKIFDRDSGGHKAAAGFNYPPTELPKLFYLLQTY